MSADAQVPWNSGVPAETPVLSAAMAHENRITGVILTGCLDGGTAGLNAVHRCGGICVVQDPDDADYPDMPRSAMRATAGDHCVPLAEIGALLTELVHPTQGAAWHSREGGRSVCFVPESYPGVTSKGYRGQKQAWDSCHGPPPSPWRFSWNGRRRGG
jgi:hypothetical protein